VASFLIIADLTHGTSVTLLFVYFLFPTVSSDGGEYLGIPRAASSITLPVEPAAPAGAPLASAGVRLPSSTSSPVPCHLSFN
jgi:hypothetical protein